MEIKRQSIPRLLCLGRQSIAALAELKKLQAVYIEHEEDMSEHIGRAIDMEKENLVLICRAIRLKEPVELVERISVSLVGDD